MLQYATPIPITTIRLFTEKATIMHFLFYFDVFTLLKYLGAANGNQADCIADTPLT